MGRILSVIDVIERQFPHDAPSTMTCLATATTKRNSFVAINGLPVKVFVKIIRSAASDRELEWRSGTLIDPNLLKNLSQLGLVCRYWKHTIDEEGSLWAFLAADAKSLRPLKTAIAKSQGVPVVITSGKNQMNEKEFATTVSPLIHSCRVLCLASRMDGFSENEGVYQLVQQPAPVLEELYFQRSPRAYGFTGWVDRGSVEDPQKPRRWRTEVWILENNPERLKVLRLRHLDWCWTRLVLSNLRDLKLSFMKISASELVECILGAPRLESFDIERLTEDWAVDPPAAQPVSLPCLRRIQMQNVSMAFAHSILSIIAPLSLEHIVLFTTSFTHPVPFTENALYYQRLVSTFAAEQPAGFAALCVGPQCLKLDVQGRDKDKNAELTGFRLETPIHREEFARWLSSLWAPVEPKSPLKIFLGCWGIISPTIVPLHAGLVSALLTFDNVSELHIGFQVADIHLLYDLLSRPVLLENGKRAWGLPRLEILSVEGQPQGGELLIQMLEARYTAIANYHSGDKRNRKKLTKTVFPPSRLQKLTVIHEVHTVPFWMMVQDEALKRIVGDEHFNVEITRPRLWHIPTQPRWWNNRLT
ncbi:hypothetical protein FRC00_005187 [Tulasnella sp. 408]|nr:hypothetical protein FRC00_005187 [Tulasnella sp. 408]